MKSWIIYSTGAILGSVAVAGVSVSAVYYTKYKNLDDALQTHGRLVNIYSYASPEATTATEHKIYEVKENEKTLEDLMLDYPEDFGLSASGTFGRMVNSVFGVSAIWKVDHAYWQLCSPTYALQHPDKANPSSKIYALNTGIAGIVLNQPQIINLYKTPASS